MAWRIPNVTTGFMAMRANRYIQTSDFLSLAMIYKGTKNLTFSAQAVPPNTTGRQNQRVYAPLFAGAIDRFCTKVNGSDPMYGHFIEFYPGSGDFRYCIVRFVFTTDADGYVNVLQRLFNNTSQTWNVPQYDLEVFMQRFAPPDLF